MPGSDFFGCLFIHSHLVISAARQPSVSDDGAGLVPSLQWSNASGPPSSRCDRRHLRSNPVQNAMSTSSIMLIFLRTLENKQNIHGSSSQSTGALLSRRKATAMCSLPSLVQSASGTLHLKEHIMSMLNDRVSHDLPHFPFAVGPDTRLRLSLRVL